MGAWPADVMQWLYFCFSASIFLMHYYFDHFLFLRDDGVLTSRPPSLQHRVSTE